LSFELGATGSEDTSSQSEGASNPDIHPKLAHDLSNTLAAAIAAARLISRKTEDDDIKELADIVLRQLDKATMAIHDASE
jgi:nitrogen-specific signal transduction histidine kinase